MAQTTELKAQARDRVGKGAARELRRQGLVPAVIYGDKKPPVTISIPFKDAQRAIYAGGFLSQVITLNVDGQKHRVIPRDYQLDVVKDFAMHVDFLRVAKGATLEVEIAVHFVNEDESPGLKRGGTLNIVRHTIPLIVDADNIPEHITVDLTGLDIGDTVHISSVKLPQGVEPSITDRDFTVATIVAPSAMKAEAAADAALDEAVAAEQRAEDEAEAAEAEAAEDEDEEKKED